MTDLREQGIQFMQQQRFSEAHQIFSRLLEERPDEWSLNYMAGQCARFYNDIPLAVRHLAHASRFNQSEPDLYLALGIAHQLNGQFTESVEALRTALKIDGDFVSAYNSLGLSQKRLGQYEIAVHNFEEGLNAISRTISKSMHNRRESMMYPHPNIRGTRWIEFAMNGAMYICAKAGNISSLGWPDGESAMQEDKNRSHAGLFWEDKYKSDGSTIRIFLPNYFNTFCALLRRDVSYSHILGNLGTVLEQIGQTSKANECYAEADEFYNSIQSGNVQHHV